MNQEIQDLIYGKSIIPRIIASEIHDGQTELFIQNKDGSIQSIFKPFRYWILSPNRLSDKWEKLEGNLHYKYIRYSDNKEEYYGIISQLRRSNKDFYTIKNEKEAAMLQYGFTYFKDITLNEISLLSFDIETTGLVKDDSSTVILISNTYRLGDKIVRKMFSYDEYDDQAGLIDAWCSWVREMDPSIMLGHNIQSYDIPYLHHIAEREGTQLNLGRNGSAVNFNSFVSKFRKDASMFYEYTGCNIFGREIVDTMFLSIKYDFARKYESYGLKNIIKQEGMEKEGRVFYDAGEIRNNYKNPVEYQKIKDYCKDDSDDALALFDLMIPAQFYFNRSVPKPLTMVINSATGSPINAILVRSYLQHKHSIPKQTEKHKFRGAISYGKPGIYTNCWKVDVASLYPSIILAYDIWDRKKDPNGNFYKMVKYFTEQRLSDKKKAQETGDKYYVDLEQSRKVVINSAYGVFGAVGLNFNSPANAALITEKGREVLQTSIKWARGSELSDEEMELESDEDETE